MKTYGIKLIVREVDFEQYQKDITKLFKNGLGLKVSNTLDIRSDWFRLDHITLHYLNGKIESKHNIKPHL